MAGRGPTPKDPRLRQRRNKAATRAEAVASEAVATPVIARALPVRPCPCVALERGRRKRERCPSCRGAKIAAWHPRTLAWWADVWSPERNPFCGQYLPVDVYGLEEIATLRDQVNWAGAHPSLDDLREIRLREPRFGLDVMGRRSLQWELKKPPAPRPQQPQPPTAGSSARDPRKVLFLDEARGGKRA